MTTIVERDSVQIVRPLRRMESIPEMPSLVDLVTGMNTHSKPIATGNSIKSKEFAQRAAAARSKIAQLKAEGKTNSKIALLLEVSRTTLYEYLREYKCQDRVMRIES